MDTASKGHLPEDTVKLEADADEPQPPARPTQFRYELGGLLGSGAMGQVFKAFDLQLTRHVALKLVLGGLGGGENGILKEARIQAQVEHPHICKVYEVGEEQGQQFIAMQLIDGPTLRAARKRLSQEQALRIVRQVAEALHAAHHQGLIHRDVKPGNVLLEMTSGGQWHPYVLDFGLACRVDAPGETGETRVVEGTPHYMAPEQARGGSEQLDRRADVYGLGATLYYVLSGETPYPDGPLETILQQVISEEPRPLRRFVPTIPRDLEAICQKSMEKNPVDRYPSTRAMAEDLERYLNGEPVLAHGAGLRYRLAKKLQRHKALVGVSALALLISGVAAGSAVRAQWQAQRQIALVHELGEEIQAIENIMDRSYLLPRHDLRPTEALVRDRMSQIGELLRQSGEEGAGPGAYALGRGHLALAELEPAVEELRKAWELGYRRPEVAYALGLALGTLYQRELRGLERLLTPELKQARKSEIETTLRDPSLEFLRQGQGAEMDSPRYAAALVDFYEGRYEGALAEAQQARAQKPWLHRAAKLEGDVHLAIGDKLRGEGKYAEALDSYENAAVDYATAIEIGRSDPGGYEGLCAIALAQMELELYGRQGDASRYFEPGRQACDRALQIDPEQAQVLRLSSSLDFRLGEYAIRQGRDPHADFQRSFEASRKLLALAPQDADAHAGLGNAYRVQALFEAEAGLDPRSSVEAAVASLREAIRLNPGFAAAYNILGITYEVQAGYERSHGVDPRPSVERSALALGKSLALAPGFAYAYSNLAFVLTIRAQFELEHSLDPSEALGQSLAAAKAALAANPKFAYPFKNIAIARQLQARLALRRGSDPGPSLDEAVAAAKQALELSPRFGAALVALGDAHATRAEYERSAGHDPSSSLADARAAYDKALEINPRQDTALAGKARLQALEAAPPADKPI